MDAGRLEANLYARRQSLDLNGHGVPSALSGWHLVRLGSIAAPAQRLKVLFGLEPASGKRDDVVHLE